MSEISIAIALSCLLFGLLGTIMALLLIIGGEKRLKLFIFFFTIAILGMAYLQGFSFMKYETVVSDTLGQEIVSYEANDDSYDLILKDGTRKNIRKYMTTVEFKDIEKIEVELTKMIYDENWLYRFYQFEDPVIISSVKLFLPMKYK